MSRSPEDFPKSHFDGGKNQTGAGVNLVGLLNVVNRAFFDGTLNVHITESTGECLFSACCPFTGEPMTGNYIIQIALHDIMGEPPFPFSMQAVFTNPLAGRILEGEDTASVIIMTNEDGKFACEIAADGDGKTEELLYASAFTYIPSTPTEMLPHSKIYMVRPVNCEPFCVQKASTTPP